MVTVPEIARLDAIALSSAIKSREISCVEVMRSYLDHIERINPHVNAIVSMQDRDELIADAKERDAQIARGEEVAFFAGERAAVHGEDHGQRGFVDEQWLERFGIEEIGNAFADGDAFDSRDGDKISGAHTLRFIALESTKSVELGDARGNKFSVEFVNADVFSAL